MSRYNILLVDDEKEILNELSIYLESEHYTCEIASNGQEGLDKTAQSQFDIIISDVRMPKLNGFDLLTKVMLNDHKPKFILVTGHGDLEGAQSALRNGAFDYILKPIQLSDLLHSIKRAEKELYLERQIEEYALNLELEKRKIESILCQILPKSIVDELIANGKVEPKFYESATVLFADFTNFTTHCERLSPKHIVEELDVCFSSFDAIVSEYALEKVKTIGDGYMAVGGVPHKNPDHALNACHAGLEITNFISKRRKKIKNYWDVRVGIHTGSLVAGVIGKSKFNYDIWGDTVNLASRMESCATSGSVNLSKSTYEQISGYFSCEERGYIEVKNKGKVLMYTLC